MQKQDQDAKSFQNAWENMEKDYETKTGGSF